MVVCPSCRTENGDGSRFCNGCGSRLTGESGAAPVQPVEERKVITVVFCDLVGFTALSERADPEDVDRMLSRYFAMARRHVEGHGGVVEKFIGDAVVGVFGVPTAHEDDPERAVRAALRICEDAQALSALRGAPLRLRVGINTGEALVRLDVAPGGGERFLAGDTINTASRIQSVAPEMGVAVGEATHAATRTRFVYEPLPPATLKGKADPVRVFQPREPLARLGIDLAETGGPFVGRETELAAIKRTFDEVVESGSVRSVLLSGEPGLGKSRLVAELLRHVEDQPVLVTWRQGRCLPYGAGISFWALGEIVKAHAGILESDPASVALEKLDDVLPNSDERAWFRERLLPLIGLDSGARAERDEQFAAWTRFLEFVAADGPTILVFEDLHWADDPLLDFLEELRTRASRVPLLIVGTTRPELLERRDAFAGDRLGLTPLSPSDTVRLAERLLDDASIAPELRARILDRAAGNPLFVGEFVRLLTEREQLVAEDGRLVLRQDQELELPSSIQTLISARLDALPPAWKSALADAAVVGKVFWSGAVAAIGARDDSATADALAGLSRREFVRASARSSMTGETEYAFGHVLTRDVAYGAIPRAGRASRHVAAGAWIERQAADRLEDVAELLAHHYTTAMDLAAAVEDEETVQAAKPSALRFLLLAGERALGLDVQSAVRLLDRALGLAPEGDPVRARIQAGRGRALSDDGRTLESIAAFEEAIVGYRAAGDVLAAAENMAEQTSGLREAGDPRVRTRIFEAVDLLEPLGPSPELAHALARVAAMRCVAGELDDAIRTGERALEVARQVEFRRSGEAAFVEAYALGFSGMARATSGDARGVDEMRAGIERAKAGGRPGAAGHLYADLASVIGNYRGSMAAVALLDEAIAFASSRGLRWHEMFLRAGRYTALYELGRFDELLEGLPAQLAVLEASGSLMTLHELRTYGVRCTTLRGVGTETAELDWLESTARSVGDPEALVGLAAAALAWLLRGETDRARALIHELTPIIASGRGWFWVPRTIPSLVRAAIALDDLPLAERLADAFAPRSPIDDHARVAVAANVAEAHGDLGAAAGQYHDAADRWQSFAIVPESGFAALGEGRCLMRLGRRDEAAQALGRARTIFTGLGALPLLEAVDDALRQVDVA
jgi:class 3 adenylate cyclase/tetratricopeptide (TPR) repeat protein